MARAPNSERRRVASNFIGRPAAADELSGLRQKWNGDALSGLPEDEIVAVSLVLPIPAEVLMTSDAAFGLMRDPAGWWPLGMKKLRCSVEE